MKRLCIILVVIVFVFSCGKRVTSYEDAFLYTKINSDPYTGMVDITSPSYSESMYKPIGRFTYLRYIKTSDGKGFYEIYASVNNGYWMFLDSAYENGKSLEFKSINRNVLTANRVTESFSIKLDNNEISRYIQQGINVKVMGKKGYEIINIPSDFVKGFNDKVEQLAK